MKIGTAFGLIVIVVLLIVVNGAIYVIPEGQQAVITQFGRPVKAVTEAGLKFKTPFIQEVNRMEKRLIAWDGDPQNMPTKDKRLVDIDVWARWRIVDPLKFFTAVRTQASGHQRLDDYVDSAVRGVIAKNNLIDAVRTTDDRLEYESEELEQDWSARRERVGPGRLVIETKIKELASVGLRENLGMELVSVRIKRVNYILNVREKVYERMRSERMRIASLFESEAEEEMNRILGQTNKELDEIEGEMKQKSAEIRGEADARVIQITAASFGQGQDFYRFLRQLEAYKNTLGVGTRLVLSTENEFLSQLQGNLQEDD